MDNIEAIKNDKTIKDDRLRYTKNSIPALLTYLSIILNVIYFIGIYKINDSFFYTKMIGISVLTNLLFLLASFLCSEGIKNYKKSYCFVMVALAILQIVRIFIFPKQGHAEEITKDGEVIGTVISTAKYIRCVLYLSLSSACLLTGAVVGYLRTLKLENHIKNLNK